MSKAPEAFQGVIYDALEEIIIERSPVLRGTREEAYADALALIAVVNAAAEDTDEDERNWTVGRVDESYCYIVSTLHGIDHDYQPTAVA
jgi:hypothetical protein